MQRAGFDTLATYTYDQIGRRTRLEQEDGGTSRTVNYFYEADSALDQLQHLMGGSNDVDYFFSYNLANQVTVRTVNNPTFQFAPVAREETYTANGLNQYTSMVKDQVLRNFTYDANGNLTSDGVWTYTFDVENRLVNATDGSTNVTYVYDPLGRRVKKSGAGVTETYYLSDGTEEVLELNSSGQVQNRYVFGPGVDEPILMYAGSGVANGAKRYYRADPQGSIIALTDYQGNVVDTYTYDAYGNPDDPSGQPIRYTGRRFDAETGLYYYRARMLSPAIGRFLQTDPVGYGDNTNLYGYVKNDPVNNSDPFGLDTCPGFKEGECVRADTATDNRDKDINVTQTEENDKFVTENKNEAASSSTSEKWKKIVERETGEKTLEDVPSKDRPARGGRFATPASRKTDIESIEGSEGALHGHLPDDILAPGDGDDQVVTKVGVPNNIVGDNGSGRVNEDVGVVEIVDGIFQFRCASDCTFSEKNMDFIQKQLDKFQTDFEKKQKK